MDVWQSMYGQESIQIGCGVDYNSDSGFEFGKEEDIRIPISLTLSDKTTDPPIVIDDTQTNNMYPIYDDYVGYYIFAPVPPTHYILQKSSDIPSLRVSIY